MPIDITNAVAKGNVAEMVGTYASHYVLDDVKGFTIGAFTENKCIIETIYYLPTGSTCQPVDVKKCGSQFRSFINIYIKNHDFYYKSNIPVCYCFLDKPESAGVNAFKITNVNRKKMIRIFIVSGALTGSAFGILYKKNSIYIIHAGQSEQSENQYTIEQKCADIYRMINTLEDNQEESDVTLLTPETLFEKLCEYQINGSIYFHKSDLKDDIRVRDGLCFESYRSRRLWELGRQHIENVVGDVIFVQNEEMVRNMTCRNLKNNVINKNVNINDWRVESPIQTRLYL